MWYTRYLAAALLAPWTLFSADTGTLASRDERYRLQPLDVLEFSFAFSPEFNQTQTVKPDGFVTLAGAGELKLAGLTVPEAVETVRKSYSGTLHEPIVTVTLKDFAKPAVVVGGWVAKPGRFEIRGPITLIDALSMAGWVLPGTKDSEVMLFRRVSNEIAEVKKVNVKAMVQKGRREEDILLRGGYAIFVSRSKAGKFERFMQVSRLGFYFNAFPYTF